jgi:hypothetical protein
MRASASRAGLVGVAAALAVAAPAAGAVRVQQLVVQKDGSARQAKVKAGKAHVHVHGDDCAVPSATALAALVHSDPPKLRLHDYGSCSGRARDAGGLFVRAMGGDANKGVDGWVYKVDNRLATAGAADPAGPFGNGRLDGGARIAWFYCHLDTEKHSCQRTLALEAKARANGVVHVHVAAYDDRGHGKPAGGATVHAGEVQAKTDADGDADLALGSGRHFVYASRKGAIRSFREEVDSP